MCQGNRDKKRWWRKRERTRSLNSFLLYYANEVAKDVFVSGWQIMSLGARLSSFVVLGFVIGRCSMMENGLIWLQLMEHLKIIVTFFAATKCHMWSSKSPIGKWHEQHVQAQSVAYSLSILKSFVVSLRIHARHSLCVQLTHFFPSYFIRFCDTN